MPSTPAGKFSPSTGSTWTSLSTNPPRRDASCHCGGPSPGRQRRGDHQVRAGSCRQRLRRRHRTCITAGRRAKTRASHRQSGRQPYSRRSQRHGGDAAAHAQRRRKPDGHRRALHGRSGFTLGAASIEAFKCNVAYYSGNMFRTMGAGDVPPFDKLDKLRGPALGFSALTTKTVARDVAKIDARLTELGMTTSSIPTTAPAMRSRISPTPVTTVPPRRRTPWLRCSPGWKEFVRLAARKSRHGCAKPGTSKG